MDYITNEILEEIEVIVAELENGAQFAVTKGGCGFDISEEANDFIIRLLQDYLDKGA